MTDNIEGTSEFNRQHTVRISAEEQRRRLHAQYSATQAVHGQGEKVDQARERLQRFDDNTTIVHKIIQSVVAESPYHSYPPTLDDGVWDAVYRLEEENALPEGITAFDLYQCFLRVFHYRR